MGLLKVTSKRVHQTIVMITHNEEIAQMADRILQIEMCIRDRLERDSDRRRILQAGFFLVELL